MIIDARVHRPVVPDDPTLAMAKARLLSDMAASGIDHALVIADHVPGSQGASVAMVFKLALEAQRN